MAMLTLNGAALPEPSALSVELQDALLSARRTLSGAASVSRAAVKRRVRCYWAYMPAAQLAAMLSALAGSAVLSRSADRPKPRHAGLLRRAQRGPCPAKRRRDGVDGR